MRGLAVTLAVCVAVAVAAMDGAAARDWDKLDAQLQQAVANRAFPGCAAMVVAWGNPQPLYAQAFGHFTYGDPAPASGTNPAVNIATLWDLASLTKVLATTTSAMILYQLGQLDLDMLVADPALLGPAFAAQGKAAIRVRNLMLHNAGFPPDPVPGFWRPDFGCPATVHGGLHPPLEFSCQARIAAAVLNQTLINPPGSTFVYSDLSMITMMYVVGRLAFDHGHVSRADARPDCMAGMPAAPAVYQCYYEAFVRKMVLEEVGMPSSGFLPAPNTWSGIAPTWNDTAAGAPGGVAYRNRVMQGQVSDENAYALGGIAGHAGLFSSAPEIAKLLLRLGGAAADDSWVNATTVRTFTTAANLSQSSRALGWDTNDYTKNTYRGCGNLSALTWTHTGYNGLEVCNDPQRSISTILLTNRVYPMASDASEDAIHHARQNFNNLVKDIIDSGKQNQWGRGKKVDGAGQVGGRG